MPCRVSRFLERPDLPMAAQAENDGWGDVGGKQLQITTRLLMCPASIGARDWATGQWQQQPVTASVEPPRRALLSSCPGATVRTSKPELLFIISPLGPCLTSVSFFQELILSTGMHQIASQPLSIRTASPPLSFVSSSLASSLSRCVTDSGCSHLGTPSGRCSDAAQGLQM